MKEFIITLILLGCGWGQTRSKATSDEGRLTPTLPDFSYTQGWLGADDAYSIALAPHKSLWLFGDTFVGNSQTKRRSDAITMVRNSIGISVCDPGRTCSMDYFWQKPTSSKPRSFFDTGTDELWYWPLDGYLDGNTLYVALLAVRNKPGTKPADAYAFGFEIAGTSFATVGNVHAPPEKWQIKIEELTDTHLWAGISMVPDGQSVIWYTQVSTGEGKGYMTAMRVPRDKMSKPSSAWQYLRKDGQWTAGLARDDAMHVIEQPISEMSVRYHPSIKKWLALSTGPEFPSRIAVARSSDSATGPWSAPSTIYEFPEMKPDRPGYDKDTFCYAVKEHIEFTDTRIALTYACNSMVVDKAVANMDIYAPRVVILDLPK